MMFDPAMVLFSNLLPAHGSKQTGPEQGVFKPVSRRAWPERQRLQRFFLAALGPHSYLRSPFKE